MFLVPGESRVEAKGVTHLFGHGKGLVKTKIVEGNVAVGLDVESSLLFGLVDRVETREFGA